MFFSCSCSVVQEEWEREREKIEKMQKGNGRETEIQWKRESSRSKKKNWLWRAQPAEVHSLLECLFFLMQGLEILKNWNLVCPTLAFRVRGLASFEYWFLAEWWCVFSEKFNHEPRSLWEASTWQNWLLQPFAKCVQLLSTFLFLKPIIKQWQS